MKIFAQNTDILQYKLLSIYFLIKVHSIAISNCVLILPIKLFTALTASFTLLVHDSVAAAVLLTSHILKVSLFQSSKGCFCAYNAFKTRGDCV